MKVGDLVKYVPTSLEQETEVYIGVVVEVDGHWRHVLWMGDMETHAYTVDSLEVINESR